MFIVLPLEISQWLAVYCHQYVIPPGATSSAFWQNYDVAWYYPFVLSVNWDVWEVLFQNFLFDIFSKNDMESNRDLKLPTAWISDGDYIVLIQKGMSNLFSFRWYSIYLSRTVAEWMHFGCTLCCPGCCGVKIFKPVILLNTQQCLDFLWLGLNLLLIFISLPATSDG